MQACFQVNTLIKEGGIALSYKLKKDTKRYYTHHELPISRAGRAGTTED